MSCNKDLNIQKSLFFMLVSSKNLVLQAFQVQQDSICENVL